MTDGQLHHAAAALAEGLLAHRRLVLPYKDPTDFDRIVDGPNMPGRPE